MKTIVTGATGGLGRTLVECLLARGHEVLACGRNREIGAALGAPFRAFDLADRDQTLALLEPADVIFHCAALSAPWGRPEDFERANVTATANVLAAMRAHGIGRLVHVSSPIVYFDFRDHLNLPESFRAARFANAYAASKYRAERLVSASGLAAVILRPRGIFGEYDSALLPRLLRVAARGALPLAHRPGRNPGDALIDVTYAGNAAEALLAAAQVNLPDAPEARIFNITNAEPMRVADLYRLVADTLGLRVRFRALPHGPLHAAAAALELWGRLRNREPLITRYTLGTVSFDQTLDISAARSVLGYRPRYTLAQGLERYARSRTGH